MTARPLILIVDDEPQIHRFLKPSLVAAGYEVSTALSATDAKAALTRRPPDVLLLDLGLPDQDGKTIIEAVRARSSLPIIVLSARDQEAEKIACLDLGADDFVNKPFNIGELLARIRAVLRRQGSQAEQSPVYAVGSLMIDHAAHQVSLAGQVIHLTPKEFDLLALLARNAGRVITHRLLLEKVWGQAHVFDTQYLRVFIGQLRQKLEADPSDPKIILTEPGVGYRIAEAD